MTVRSSDEASPSRALGPVVGDGEHSDAFADSHLTGPNDAAQTTVTLPADDHEAHTPANLPNVGGAFGTLLEPVLRRACGGRLGEVAWFRADWQRGGALTGYSTYEDDAGEHHPVVVKLPVPPCERYFLQALQHGSDVVPRLYAHGEALNGYDLAWVVMERLPHGPLGPLWGGVAFDLVTAAVGRFYAAARDLPRRGQPRHKDWEALLDTARQQAKSHALPDPQRWKAALKKAHKKCREWARIWNDRNTDGWVHGDLHLGNAMTRQAPPNGPAVLIDFANTRVGHWLEDAIYFERLFWRQPERLEGRKLCTLIAHERKRRGLPVEPDWPRLADAERALVAMCTPAALVHDGDPQHLQAALKVLERAVG